MEDQLSKVVNPSFKLICKVCIESLEQSNCFGTSIGNIGDILSDTQNVCDIPQRKVTSASSSGTVIQIE